MNEITITKENFDEEVRNFKGMPVLLDFWAGWCGPCMMLSPIIEEIADEYDGKIKVGKVNVDEQPELAAAFRVESIPLVVVVKDGAVTAGAVGYRSKEDIIALLEK
ncbi:MAG: thioredoxin [Ruminococcus sp.]|nr:thioredoxin [Ruminococcus sp.]